MEDMESIWIVIIRLGRLGGFFGEVLIATSTPRKPPQSWLNIVVNADDVVRHLLAGVVESMPTLNAGADRDLVGDISTGADDKWSVWKPANIFLATRLVHNRCRKYS